MSENKSNRKVISAYHTLCACLTLLLQWDLLKSTWLNASIHSLWAWANNVQHQREFPSLKQEMKLKVKHRHLGISVLTPSFLIFCAWIGLFNARLLLPVCHCSEKGLSWEEVLNFGRLICLWMATKNTCVVRRAYVMEKSFIARKWWIFFTYLPFF